MRGAIRRLQVLAIFWVLLCLAPSVHGATIDLMIVYDSTAKSWVAAHGGMNTFAANAVARMNQATANSGLDLTFRLVHAAEVSYTHSGDLETDTYNLQSGAGSLSVVHEWRDAYGADLVAMLVDTGSETGTVGFGYLLSDPTGQPDYAFSVNAIRSVDISHTLTHEAGHNLGCNHSKYQSTYPGPNTALNTYSAGWYFTGTDTVPYHTIMAYGSDGYGNTYTEAPVFSTPLLRYQGTVAGHAADGDNARNIRETMGVVAAYRSPVTLTVSTASFSAAAATGSIAVTAPADLTWTAASKASWITVTSGARGTGNGTVAYSVAQNLTGATRVGTITVEGRTFTVTQSGGVSDIWLPKTDFGGAARHAAVGFSIGERGYIGTGWDGSTKMRDFWEYNPAANTWTQRADFGGTECYYAVGFSIGEKGYIGTGWDCSSYKKDFWEYNPATNDWTEKAEFGGAARGLAVGFSIGTKGYVGTGFDGSSYRKDFWEYDPAANTWTEKAPFGGTARCYAVGFSIGEKGYIGTGSDGLIREDFWEYDPAADAWTPKAEFGGTKRYNAVGFAIGDKGYVGTGSDGSNRKDFWEYDPTADAWTRKADFGGTARYYAVGFSFGTRGYIGTGSDGSNRKDFWEYTPGVAAYTPSQSGGFYVIPNKKGGAAVIYLE